MNEPLQEPREAPRRFLVLFGSASGIDVLADKMVVDASGALLFYKLKSNGDHLLTKAYAPGTWIRAEEK